MTRESQSVSSGHYASLLENEQLYDLFVSKVSRESAEIIEAHSNRVRNRTTIFVTVGLAFVAAIFALALEELKSSIKIDARAVAQEVVDREITSIFQSQRFETATTDILIRRTAEIEKRIDFLQDQVLFLNAVRDFSEEDVGFTDEQARALINGVRSAKNNDSSILSVSEVIDTIITNFAAADRYDLIEELFEIAPEEMAASSTACQSITVSLGFSLAGFEVSPQKATGRFAKQWSDYINLYKTTAENCRKLKFPEAGYVFDLVISIMEGENIEVIKAIADDTAEMSPQEIEFVRTITMGLLVGDYMKNPDSSQAVERARARTIEMIERYGVEDPTETLDSTLTFYRNNISE